MAGREAREVQHVLQSEHNKIGLGERKKIDVLNVEGHL